MNTNSGTQNDTRSTSGTGSETGSSDSRSAIGGAKIKAGDAYSAARERTSAAYESARERAGDVTRQTAERIDSSPLVAIAGGIALGAVLGALLPRTERETQALGNVGHKMTDAARDVANTAVETGKQQVNDITSNAMQKVGEAVVQAVVSGDGAKSQ
jgi:ElaB/YqjD/DUF883 family membrane-anchored ribosome-binding protein